MKKCMICGELITGNGITLEDGATVCADCMSESAEIVECEGCGGKFLAKNILVHDGTTYCRECLIGWFLDDIYSDFKRVEEWEKDTAEDGGTPTAAGYEEFAKDFLREFGPHTKRIAAVIENEIDEEIEKAKKTLRAA